MNFSALGGLAAGLSQGINQGASLGMQYRQMKKMRQQEEQEEAFKKANQDAQAQAREQAELLAKQNGGQGPDASELFATRYGKNVIDHLIANGDMERAAQMEKWLGDKAGKSYMKSWSNAFNAYQSGDDAALVENMKRLHQLTPDGYDIQDVQRAEDGSFAIRYKGGDGREGVMNMTRDQFVEQGMSYLSPEKRMEYELNKATENRRNKREDTVRQETRGWQVEDRDVGHGQAMERQQAGFQHAEGMQARTFDHSADMQGRQFQHAEGMQGRQLQHAEGMQERGFDHSRGMQDDAQGHQRGMYDIQRRDRVTDDVRNRGWQVNDREDSQQHAAGMQGAGFAHQQGMQDDSQQHQTGMMQTQRGWQESDAVRNRGWQQADAVRDRVWRVDDREDTQGHATGMQASSQAHATDMQGRGFVHQKGMQDDSQQHATGMQASSQQHASGMQERGFTHQRGMQDDAQGHSRYMQDDSQQHATGMQGSAQAHATRQQERSFEQNAALQSQRVAADIKKAASAGTGKGGGAKDGGIYKPDDIINRAHAFTKDSAKAELSAVQKELESVRVMGTPEEIAAVEQKYNSTKASVEQLNSTIGSIGPVVRKYRPDATPQQLVDIGKAIQSGDAAIKDGKMTVALSKNGGHLVRMVDGVPVDDPSRGVQFKALPPEAQRRLVEKHGDVNPATGKRWDGTDPKAKPKTVAAPAPTPKPAPAPAPKPAEKPASGGIVGAAKSGWGFMKSVDSFLRGSEKPAAKGLAR